MSESNYDPVYLEILRMAKELVVQEYTDIRAQDHNQWLVESEHLWRTQRLRLAYPTIPTPPTEKDVIVKAQILLDFLRKQEAKRNIVDQTLTTKEIVELEEKEQAMKQDIVKVEPIEDAKEITSEPAIQDTKEQDLPDAEKLSGRLLPSVLKKIEELKNNWSKN